jgi:hypothetical protein
VEPDPEIEEMAKVLPRVVVRTYKNNPRYIVSAMTYPDEADVIETTIPMFGRNIYRDTGVVAGHCEIYAVGDPEPYYFYFVGEADLQSHLMSVRDAGHEVTIVWRV